MGPSQSKMLRGLVFAASGAARVAGPCSNQRALPIVQTALLCTARRPGVSNKDNLFDMEGEWTSDAECRNMWYVDLCDKRTVWHAVEAKTQASKVIIMPAPAGHGVIANKTTGALCRMMGITDVMIKTHGTPNPWSIVAAMQKALEKMTSPQEVAMVRGMRVHDITVKMGKAHP